MPAPRIYGEESTYNPTGNAVFRAMRDVLYLQPGSKLRTDPDLGYETVRRKWLIKTDLLVAENSPFRPRPGDVDLRYRTLKYAECEITENGPVSEISTLFVGWIDRAGSGGRKVKTDFDTQLQQLPVVINGATATMIYYAPIIVNRYAARKRPDDNERPAALPTDKPRIWDIRNGAGISLANAHKYSDILTDVAGIYEAVERGSFQRTEFAPDTGVWICSETITRFYRQQAESIVLS